MGALLMASATTVILCCIGRWRSGLVLLCVALIVLWISSTPGFAVWLNSRLESEVPYANVETLPQSDVIVLLGGVGADLDNPANRIVRALQIYRAGKASIILISSGNLAAQSAAVPDASVIADRLVRLGVPRSALVLETESRNTRENAVHTATTFNTHGWRNGLLVTSAIHMPRALAAFQKVGLNVIPARSIVDITPSASDSRLSLRIDKDSLLRTTSAIKEIVGLLVYRCLGWA
jgi:uncharacterized SAM-binding protein YcdF (DUF218 family)